MGRKLCAKFHAGTKVLNLNFSILANIDFSAQTKNTIRLKHYKVDVATTISTKNCSYNRICDW